MPDDSRLRRLPIRVIKWLGHDVLQEHPLIRMLHESRAIAAAREKAVPLQERPSYQIRQQRVFARGRLAHSSDEAIAAPPDQPAAAEPPASEPADPAADALAAEPTQP